MKFRAFAVFLFAYAYIFQSCAEISSTITISEVNANIINEIHSSSGFDDLLMEGSMIILGERNSGRLKIFYSDIQEERIIEPYLNIAVLSGELYYKSTYDWTYRKFDLSDDKYTELRKSTGNDILMPLGGDDYIIYNDGTGEATEKIGSIEKTFYFTQTNFGTIAIKNAEFSFAGYDGRFIKIVNAKGWIERIFDVGEVHDYAVDAGGLLVLCKDELLFVKSNGDKKVIIKTGGDILCRSGNTAAVYDKSGGVITLIKLSYR